MRAGEQIWDFAESEGTVQPGKRRPTIVVDEQRTHLAHTDRMLSMLELYRRVQVALETYEVPVDVKLVKAHWINDTKEVRERIVASLRGHVFQDVKVIFGLDYMGRWASIHISIGQEPTAIEADKPFRMSPYVLYAILGGAAALVTSAAIGKGAIALAGFVVTAFGVWRYLAERKAYESEMVKKKGEAAIKRAIERQSRTYKVDDMGLFCTAMKAVYQSVVDDIVKSGAQVVRVDGGRGGYFSGGDNQVRGPSAKLTDAAESEV